MNITSRANVFGREQCLQSRVLVRSMASGPTPQRWLGAQQREPNAGWVVPPEFWKRREREREGESVQHTVCSFERMRSKF